MLAILSHYLRHTRSIVKHITELDLSFKFSSIFLSSIPGPEDMEKDYINNIDELRDQEYPMLQSLYQLLNDIPTFAERTPLDTTYLDHAGTTLYSKSLIEQLSNEMLSSLFGNPHSASPSSKLSTCRIEQIRLRVLEFLKADPDDFDLVFVANATAGIKIVMDAFRDLADHTSQAVRSGFWYGYHRDSHTSLVGVRQVSLAGSRCFQSDEEVNEWLAEKLDTSGNCHHVSSGRISLFAYPAQSNMNGRRLPRDWPGRIRSSTHPDLQNTYTLLDAAAYVSTAQLDLSDSDTAPDFTTLSFYKIFGYPDLGALVIRKAVGHLIKHRYYFGGGTVDTVVSIGEEWHAKKRGLHEQLEDGTLPFHNIIALGTAIDVHERLYSSMDRISRHTCYLGRVLYTELSALRHANGQQVCEIYREGASEYGCLETQGPTIAFNIRNSKGDWIGKTDFEQLAIAQNIQLRTGGVCNPGGIATWLKLTPTDIRESFSQGGNCGGDFDFIHGKPTGVIRVSFGAMSSLRDIKKLLCFIKATFLEPTKLEKSSFANIY